MNQCSFYGFITTITYNPDLSKVEIKLRIKPPVKASRLNHDVTIKLEAWGTAARTIFSNFTVGDDLLVPSASVVDDGHNKYVFRINSFSMTNKEINEHK